MATLLDIVDEDDNVVGTATSEEAHARLLLHRFVQVMVVGSDGRVLLQQRSRSKARGALLLDASVGGHVDSGEGYLEAALREGREEIGLDAPLTFLGRLRDDAPPVENMLGMLYLARSDGPFVGWEAEAERLFWLRPEELLSATESMPFLFTGPMPQVARMLAEVLPRA
jgi:8-oxo-dGTP pyrophosphatase MutT (NUDIX family)